MDILGGDMYILGANTFYVLKCAFKVLISTF